MGFGGASSALCAFEEHAQNGAARREPKSRVPLGFGGASSALCASKYRNYGRTAKYRHELPGYISRLDELHAALLRRVGLANLDDWTARRRAIALRYLGCIDNGRVSIPGAPAHSEYVWHLLPVLVEPESRLGFLAHLKANGISAAEHYPAALFEQPVMGVPYEMPAVCSNARRLCQSEVSLPIQPYLTDDECVRVIEACNGWSG
ncbi:MAG: DegT/DnrJ/EryC1/StrS family aminotransferase [Acidobacteriia bacterium]|nr:DegT/DnrJ/EryC1/StrS family aminotransferase [Terriglobia bacterium]